MLLFIVLTLVATAYAKCIARRSRIIGGYDAQRGTFPYQVSLVYPSGFHFCGGVVIDQYWVLTAAHCVGSDPSQYRVVINKLQLVGDEHEEWLPIKRIISHERYTQGAGNLANDIALLEVGEPIPSNNIIRMAEQNEEVDGSFCVISGWGYTTTSDDIGSQSAADILQYAIGNAVSNDHCSIYWGNHINDGHICYYHESPGAGVSGACMGDSGGPMVCGGVLAGVTSWGQASCGPNYPSVYTRVAYFRDWIDSKMSNSAPVLAYKR